MTIEGDDSLCTLYISELIHLMHCTHNGPAKNAALIILINTTHCAINGFVLGIMCCEWGVSSCAGGV